MEPKRAHHNLTFTILAASGMAFALLQSLVAPALREIQTDLHTTTTAVAWVFTGSLLSTSVATPIIGRLGDMFGKKRVLVVTLTVVAAGTLVCALATSIGVLIAGRVIQGVGGAVFPLAFGIIRDEFPIERVATRIATISALLGAGAGLGIVLSGPIADNLSYHWLFWFPLVAVSAAAVAALIVIPESPIRAPGRIDWAGGLLLTSWLVALLVAVSEGRTWGWGSARVLGLECAAVVLVFAWVAVEQRAHAPLVDMRMMQQHVVWTTNLTGFLFGFGMYTSLVLTPTLVQLPKSGIGFGASVTGAGLFMLPTTMGMLVVGPVAGRMSSTVGPKVPLVAGALFGAAAFCVLAVAHSASWQIYVSTALLGIGIGLAFGAMANLIVSAVRPEETGVATGMNTIVRTIGGSVGSQIAATIIATTTNRAFTAAFVVSASALAVSFLVSFAIPGRRRVGEVGLVRSGA